MSKIKICGLSRKCDIDYVNELMPDYIGFVFAKSRRQIDRRKAEKLREMLNENIQTVGVFVNEDINEVADIANNSIIDMIQLHGSEDETYVKSLRYKTDAKIIKAFKINSYEDIKMANESDAEYILLDNGNGGTGESFDWGYVDNIDRPYFLAGGINESNLEAALRLQPYAIDLSSGIETDGFKDYNKIKNVIRTVRGSLPDHNKY